MARTIKFYHNNKSIYTAQNLIWRDNSKCIHAHTYTQAPAHTSIFFSLVAIFKKNKLLPNHNKIQIKRDKMGKGVGGGGSYWYVV